MEQTTITGFLGRDAQAEQQGDYYTLNFSIGVTRKWKDKKENKEVERTNWYSVFKRQKSSPEKTLSHLKKGVKVFIQGEPSYTINNHGQSMSVQVIINASKMEILTFKDENNE